MTYYNKPVRNYPEDYSKGERVLYSVLAIGVFVGAMFAEPVVNWLCAVIWGF